MAYQAIEVGGTSPTILNAANEVAVQAFLDGNLAFTDIPILIENVLGTMTVNEPNDLETILKDDRLARERAFQQLASIK